jgi:anaerobic magnesium-protoporphyrin IX monomethyl ester cyclase
VRPVLDLGDGLTLAVETERVAGGPGAGDPAEDAASAYPTARLSRGLLLLDRGRELGEEGVGFGVPVVKRGAQAVFSGAADVVDDGAGRVTITYGLDLVERLRRGNGGELLLRPLDVVREALAAVHRRVPPLRRLLTAASVTGRRVLGLSTSYRRTPPLATIPVTYSALEGGGGVRICVDLSRVPSGVTEVVLMNELSAYAFDRFVDADGADLHGDAIGTWDEVAAADASFASSATGVSFTLQRRPDAGAPDVRLYRGREAVDGRLAWAGFGYSLKPGPRTFSYEARIQRTGTAAGSTTAESREPGADRLSVLLVYPFFRRSLDRSRFRFPPLGPAYVAASLRQAGHRVRLLDCTFLGREQALRLALAAQADVVGIYCMATMRDDALWVARRLRGRCDLLVAGGPLPTCEPEAFLRDVDVVVRGEGEQTMVDLLAAHAAGTDVGAVPGVVAAARGGAAGGGGAAVAAVGAATVAPPRPFARDLDALPFPARDLLPNGAYIRHGRRRWGFAVTTVMSTRGCPFACEFCSNVVFGDSYRERSPEGVVDEIEEALALGYDRIAFADDVFTLRRERVLAACDEIARRGLRFDWECLARVDNLDRPTADAMRRAGCRTVFFGIESGSDEVLRRMRKGITSAQARAAVWAAHDAGLEVGAFFILCYPGETDDTVLETLRFAASLPLDYLGLSMPYPLPGTALRERMEGRVTGEARPDGSLLLNQQLTYASDFSAAKMRFAILCGRGQFELRRRLGRFGPSTVRLTQAPAEALFRRLR